MSIDVAALFATVTAVVTEALTTTLSSKTLTDILKNTGPPILLEPLALESSSSVGATVTAEVADILQDGHASDNQGRHSHYFKRLSATEHLYEHLCAS